MFNLTEFEQMFLSLNWLNFYLAFLICFIILIFLKYFVSKLNKLRIKNQEIGYVHVFIKSLNKFPSSLILLISFYIAFIQLGINLEENLENLLNFIFLSIILLNLANLISHAFANSLKLYRKNSNDSNKTSVISYLTLIFQIGIWFFAIAFLIEILGFDVSSLLAGLGISGLAVALSLRSFINDIVASVLLFFEKPIKLGDKIKIGSEKGIVVKIGLKSTILLKEYGDRVIVPNSYLTEKEIINFKQADIKRISFEVSLNTEKKNKLSFEDFILELINLEFKESIIEKPIFSTLEKNKTSEKHRVDLIYKDKFKESDLTNILSKQIFIFAKKKKMEVDIVKFLFEDL